MAPVLGTDVGLPTVKLGLVLTFTRKNSGPPPEVKNSAFPSGDQMG